MTADGPGGRSPTGQGEGANCLTGGDGYILFDVEWVSHRGGLPILIGAEGPERLAGIGVDGPFPPASQWADP